MIEATAIVFLMLLGFWLGVRSGRDDGRHEERHRVEGIMHCALQTRWSPTAHHALICIAGNQTRQQMVAALRKKE